MVDGIDMSQYLIKNRQYLNAPGESACYTDHEGDLDIYEVSAFFSNGHLQQQCDTFESASIISKDEFNNWYKENQLAIQAFLDEKYSGLQTDSQETQDKIYQGIMDLALKYSSSNFFLNENDDDAKGNDITGNNVSLYGEDLKFEMNMKDYQHYISSCDKDTNSNLLHSVMDDIINDSNITTEDKMSLLKQIKAKDEKYVVDYFAKDDSFFVNSLNEMVNDPSCTVDKILNVWKDYIENIQGNNWISGNDLYANKFLPFVVALHEKAAKSNEAKKLNDAHMSADWCIKQINQYTQSGYLTPEIGNKLLERIGRLYS